MDELAKRMNQKTFANHTVHRQNVIFELHLILD